MELSPICLGQAIWHTPIDKKFFASFFQKRRLPLAFLLAPALPSPLAGALSRCDGPAIAVQDGGSIGQDQGEGEQVAEGVPNEGEYLGEGSYEYQEAYDYQEGYDYHDGASTSIYYNIHLPKHKILIKGTSLRHGDIPWDMGRPRFMGTSPFLAGTRRPMGQKKKWGPL